MPRSGLSAVTQRRPVDHLDIHDSSADDVENEHAFRGTKADAPMAGSIGLALGVRLGIKALAEVVTAATAGDQAKVPGADGKLLLAFLLEQGNQLSDELGEHLAHKRMPGFHGQTITEVRAHQVRADVPDRVSCRRQAGPIRAPGPADRACCH